MFRGHLRNSPAFPASVQETILIEAGVPKRAIYADAIDDAIRSLREGNALVVAGYRGLGSNKKEILVLIGKVHARGCAVKDAATGRFSTNKVHRQKLLDEAVADLANERRGPRKPNKHQMPWDQIAKLWFQKDVRTAKVMAYVNEGRRGRARLSHSTIWRKLGKRNAITGRPSKQR